MLIRNTVQLAALCATLVLASASTAAAQQSAPAAKPSTETKASPATTDFLGDYTWEVVIPDHIGSGTMHVERKETGLAGSIIETGGPEMPLSSIVVNGRDLTFNVETPNGSFKLKGSIADDGSFAMDVAGPDGRGGKFTGKRK